MTVRVSRLHRRIGRTGWLIIIVLMAAVFLIGVGITGGIR